MGDQYLAEVKIFANTFAPYQWTYCDGQIVTISQNPALFSLLSTSFGGNGTSTFGIPNLKGRTVACKGQSPYTQPRDFAGNFGEDEVQLTIHNLPTHNHELYALKETAKESAPDNQAFYARARDNATGIFSQAYKTFSDISTHTMLNQNALARAGGTDAHVNYQPFLTMTYCIAFEGLYPPRA